MRIDVTIRCRDGREHDVAITAREHTPLGAMAGALSAAVPGAEAAWNGTRRVESDALLGGHEVRTGALLGALPMGTSVSGSGQRLEVVGGAGAGAGIPLLGGTSTVGRAATCALTVDDPLVSRQHAVFSVGRSGVTVRDTGSTHGTSVDACRTIGDHAVSGDSIVRIGETFLAVNTAVEPAAVRPGPDGTVLVNRRVGATRHRADRVINFPEPPDVSPAQRVSWAVSVAPALAGIALAVTMHSAQFLAFALLGPLALVLSGAGEKLGDRRRNKRLRRTHRLRMRQLDDELDHAIRAEVAFRRAVQPDPAAALRIARGPGVRLWHRSRGDSNLLQVRLGLGDLASTLQVCRARETVAAATLSAVPAVVDLGRSPVGLTGPQPVRDALARWLIAQLAVLCSPADVELALLIPGGQVWTWTRWLPHLRGRIACTEAEHDALISELVELARTRVAGQARQPPWLVVVVDGPDAIAAGARLASVLEGGAHLGITALFVADRASQLPGYAQVVRVVGETGGTVRLDDLDIVADRVSAQWADDVARALAPLRDAEADPAAALPSTCRLAQLLGDDSVTATSIADSWQCCDGSVQALLGLGPDGPFVVDLDRDGPHMLIAGTTGSGKSELLQSLVVGLAAQQPPSELTFLLIDYKGGSAFAECASLPHVVGVVTDLDDHLVGRVLASLDSEIRRREQMLASMRARDRAEFRAAGNSMPRL
ncbi:MAG TPA: FtsK/SpoIIIE domain-containing protein, partial [Jatrophihabitantaceae bacterium]|nr:FtsK/SpoIIIE domain-containing protein [Jatrophihabitantaceae bacterium]